MYFNFGNLRQSKNKKREIRDSPFHGGKNENVSTKKQPT